MSTSGISSELYTPLTANDVINGTLSSDIGFRAGLGTAIEFRLCQVTDNSTYDFEECELSPPLLVRNEAETENQNGAGNQNEIIYQKSFRPNSRQTYAKLSLQVKGRDRCEHCVIQAKYIPGKYIIYYNLLQPLLTRSFHLKRKFSYQKMTSIMRIL